jgi:hypothetical protein
MLRFVMNREPLYQTSGVLSHKEPVSQNVTLTRKSAYTGQFSHAGRSILAALLMVPAVKPDIKMKSDGRRQM